MFGADIIFTSIRQAWEKTMKIRSKRTISALGALSFSLGGVSLTSLSAQAATPPPYEFCRFNGQYPIIKVKNAITYGPYMSDSLQAMNDWNRTPVKTKLQAVSSGANIVIERVYQTV